ncbi:MAG: SDR family NAD(P)-dependent oxidoreductase, partial [Rhizobiaceae bacterium]
MKLSGKTAIITGAAQGIGYAIAQRFLQEGAQVVIADINDEKGEQAATELSKLGDINFVSANVGERLDVHNLIATTVDAFGDVDILVNNAGIAIGGDFLEISEDDFDKVLRVNLKGSF